MAKSPNRRFSIPELRQEFKENRKVVFNALLIREKTLGRQTLVNDKLIKCFDSIEAIIDKEISLHSLSSKTSLLELKNIIHQKLLRAENLQVLPKIIQNEILNPYLNIFDRFDPRMIIAEHVETMRAGSPKQKSFKPDGFFENPREDPEEENEIENPPDQNLNS